MSREQDRAAADVLGALTELVRLKDGPRDAAYERDKPLAWNWARRAIANASPTPITTAQAYEAWDRAIKLGASNEYDAVQNLPAVLGLTRCTTDVVAAYDAAEEANKDGRDPVVVAIERLGVPVSDEPPTVEGKPTPAPRTISDLELLRRYITFLDGHEPASKVNLDAYLERAALEPQHAARLRALTWTLADVTPASGDVTWATWAQQCYVSTDTMLGLAYEYLAQHEGPFIDYLNALGARARGVTMKSSRPATPAPPRMPEQPPTTSPTVAARDLTAGVVTSIGTVTKVSPIRIDGQPGVHVHFDSGAERYYENERLVPVQP